MVAELLMPRARVIFDYQPSGLCRPGLQEDDDTAGSPPPRGFHAPWRLARLAPDRLDRVIFLLRAARAGRQAWALRAARRAQKALQRVAARCQLPVQRGMGERAVARC